MDPDIISAIRRLDGRNLGEVRKKFFTYILANKTAITSNIETILDLFIPENNLEKFFRIKLIDIWRRKLELARIFEKEDTFYISHALKCKWFFREIEIDSAVLVNEILPNLSYFTRHKLIRQYSKYLKDKNKAEELFKALQKRYGTSIAQIILPACSSEFIETTLQSFRVRINRDLITLLYKNHPDVVINFISSVFASKASGSRLYENFELRNYDEILKLIAIYYPIRFIDMFIEYKDYFPYMSLGANVTKRIVKIYSPLVIKHFTALKQIMSVKSVIKNMNISNIEKLQAAYFPESMIDFFQLKWQFEDLGEITSRLDEVESQQIFLRNFKRCYGKEFNFEDYRKVIDLDLIILLPVEIRKKWIQLELPKLESDSEKAEYLGYLPPDIALPQIKKLIVRQKEVSVRAEMVHYMFLSAIRYKKTHNSLLECFAFLVGRLRTDSSVVRVKVFRLLEDIKDILLNMPVKEWETVEEFIDLIRMNDEDQEHSYEFINLLSLKIQRYLAEGRPMDSEISKFTEYAFSIYPYYDLSLCKGTSYRKRCLEIYISSLPNIVFERKEEKEDASISLLSILCDYNRSFKHEKIDYPDWLITEIEKLFASKECSHYSKTRMIRSFCKDNYLRNRIYNNFFPCAPTLDVIRKVLRDNPLQLKKHKETVLKEILKTKEIKSYIKLIKEIKLYDPFELPFIFQDLCEYVLKTKQLDPKIYKPSFKPNAVTFLSILMSPNEFIETITPYSQSLKEIGSYSEENKLQYKIHKAIASSLKFVATPLTVLPSAKSYTFGDYLKFVLGPINSICTKVPENKILPYLLEWESGSLSLKKHLMRTYCKIAPTTDAGKLILSLLDKQEYKSLRLVLLEYIFRFFLYDPCEERFNFFKTAYSQLTPDDVKCVDGLFDLTRIPDLFVESFMKILWEVVELKEGLLVSGSRNKIIKMIGADVLCLLSEDFCELLLKHLFSNEDITSNLEFIINYLMYSQDETILFIRLDKIMKYINDNILNNWNIYTLNCNIVCKSKKMVFEITESICQYSLKKEKLKICADSVLEKWKLFLLTSLSADEIVEELLYLESTIFIYNKDMEKSDFITELAIFYEDLLAKYYTTYGDQIISSVISSLPNCLEKKRIELAKVLLCDHESFLAHLMAIRLLDTSITKELSNYEVIIECLLKSSHPYVKCAAKSFMRNLNSEVQISET